MKHVWIVLAAAGVLVLAVRQPASRGAALAVATQSPARAFPRALAAPQRQIVVYVAGAVLRSGLYRLPAGARADDAVRAAGGFGPGADSAAINLAQHVEDGDEVRVFRVNERTPRPSRTNGPRARGRARKRAEPPSEVNINAADAGTLALLPGVGPTLAERIVAFRRANGDFQTVDELLDVAGMTQRRLDAIAPLLMVQDGR